MLPRRLALNLLAPTVLVSVVLVAACAFAAFYLNHLNINVSEALSENVLSTQVALHLEATTERLIRHLTRIPSEPQLDEKISELNERAREHLKEAEKLANYENEQALVEKIRRGLNHYFDLWDQRMSDGETSGTSNAALILVLRDDVLAPCKELHQFNTTQIAESEQQNRAIVVTLKWALLAVGIGAPIAGLLLGYAVAKSLRHSIYLLSVSIRDVAGRLNRQLGSVRLDEETDLPSLHQQMQHLREEIERVVEQLQQREREVLRAEQLAAVGQVAAGVAHELRNPLTSVKMLVQTGLEGKRPSGLPPEDLAVIESEVRRMEQCIQLFIDFARPRTARRPTDLEEVIRKALALVEGRANKQHVTLEARLPNERVEANIDAGQIHQVLLNLLLNALDALPHGGRVCVTLETAKGIEVGVHDNGPGIAPNIRDRLFEPFVSSKDIGLGLGLSISKRLVEDHGGTIRGENAPDGGAVFTFTL